MDAEKPHSYRNHFPQPNSQRLLWEPSSCKPGEKASSLRLAHRPEDPRRLRVGSLQAGTGRSAKNRRDLFSPCSRSGEPSLRFSPGVSHQGFIPFPEKPARSGRLSTLFSAPQEGCIPLAVGKNAALHGQSAGIGDTPKAEGRLFNYREKNQIGILFRGSLSRRWEFLTEQEQGKRPQFGSAVTLPHIPTY